MLDFVNAHIGEILNAIVALGVAWIGYKQATLHSTMAVLEKNVNNKMDKLLIVTGESEKAKGNLEGRAEQKAENKEKRV